MAILVTGFSSSAGESHDCHAIRINELDNVCETSFDRFKIGNPNEENHYGDDKGSQ
jgi:hypothetical protein